MHLRWRLCWLLWAVVGCGPFDDDQHYQPVLEGSVFRVAEANGQVSLARFSEGSWQPNWELELGIVPPLAGTVWNQRIWLLSPGKVTETSVGIGEALQQRAVAPGVAFLSAGDEWLCLLDTQRRTGTWVRPGTEGFATEAEVEFQFVPRAAAYLSGKWCVAGEDASGLHLAFVDEKSGALRSTIPLAATGPLVGIQVDGFRLQVITGAPGAFFLTAIDISGEQAADPTAETATQILLSPELRIFYGSEVLDDVFLRAGNLKPWNLPATSFAMDFQGGILYRQNDGRLLRETLHPSGPGLSEDLAPLEGTLLESWHIYQPETQ